MKLTSIKITNYKSIDSVILQLNEIPDRSQAYGIIGENEAGKSAILKAIALVDNLETIGLKINDFNDRKKSIEIALTYSPNIEDDIVAIEKALNDAKSELAVKNIEEIVYGFEIAPDDLKALFQTVTLKDKKLFEMYDDDDILDEFDLLRQNIVFWSFDPKYLVSEEIKLNDFFSNPDSISIPLKNCFRLAGYKQELKEIAQILTDSTERENLREELGLAVTKHLRRVWKKHKVKITFDITPTTLNFHIKDEGSKGKAKTIDQRSDGFRQFISFLLTVSAENVNSDLNNTLLLLDEPETHLHPKAQEDMLQELIEITQSNDNTILFATHSNYLIDKAHLERNVKVFKNNDITEIEWFKPHQSSYASINYEVFGISSTDYHNELYDYLRDKYGEDKQIPDLGIMRFDDEFFKKEKRLKLDRSNKGKSNTITLPTYIRNCIHYPSNKPKNFDLLLDESIELLKNYKDDYLSK